MKKISKSDFWAIVFVCMIVGAVIGMMGWMYHSDSNGIRVRTDEPSYGAEVPEGIQYPIEIRAYIEYDNDYIVSRDTIVEFCDIKDAKREMKLKMKSIRSEMKRRCKNY